MALCDNLKRLRAEHGLSQKEMAEKLDLNARTYASYERAEREPSTAIILKICQLFGISSDELLGNCKDEKSTPIVNDKSAGSDKYFLTGEIGKTKITNDKKECIIRGNNGIGKSALLKTLSDKPPEVYSKRRPEILTYYNKLNDKGQQEAVKRVKELTQLPDYKK